MFICWDSGPLKEFIQYVLIKPFIWFLWTGYRYELYCVARAHQTPHCVVCFNLHNFLQQLLYKIKCFAFWVTPVDIHHLRYCCAVSEAAVHISYLQGKSWFAWLCPFAILVNPFTPESDQCQNSPAASQEMWHHIVRRTWLFIAYSDERWF